MSGRDRTWNPFLKEVKQTCARLITTRRSDIVMDADRIQVDEMAPEEAAALLATHVPREYAAESSAFPPSCGSADGLATAA